MNRRISKFKFSGFVLALLVLLLAILLTACNNNSTENIGIENKVFSSEGILFSYDFKTGSYVVTGYIGSAKYVVIPSMYQSRKVTGINPDAFFGCNGIIEIKIEEGIEHIGWNSFGACSGLTSITIPGSVTSISDAFDGCFNLESVTIGKGVTKIGLITFKGCSINSVYYTGDIAGWCGIDELDTLMVHSPSLYIGGKKITDKIIIPDGVTSISASAFRNCTELTSITIPDSVTSIGYYAFRGCSSLTSITIPDSVTSIGERTFHNCSSLTSIIIPDSVESIWNGAFYNCTGLTSVTIGSGVRFIAHDVFRYCENLNTVYNKSSLSIKTGSSSNGYVAYYAKNVYNVRD